MTGFDVDLAALDEASQAVSQTMHDMKSCEIEDIVGGSAQYGHGGVHEAFEHFCDRWQYGVEMLVQDGDKIAKALNASVDAYLDVDQSAEQSMRTSGSGVDPAAEVADG